MKEIITSLSRHLLTSAGGALVGKGILASSVVDETIGAVLTLIGVIWSVVEKKFKKSAE